MNNLIGTLTVLLVTALDVSHSAEPQAGTPPSAERRGGRGSANSNDVFYRLGNDSKPMDGVPKGKFSGPKVIPSKVFPGTQHTYWVYVPAQYDPAQPTAVMIFNDGQAMMAEPGDVQAQYVLDHLIFPNGDWFYQNVRLMKALTKKGYEVNYTWGIGNHGQKQGGAIFPEMMRWLWRDQPVSTDPNDMVERSFRQ